MKSLNPNNKILNHLKMYRTNRIKLLLMLCLANLVSSAQPVFETRQEIQGIILYQDLIQKDLIAHRANPPADPEDETHKNRERELEEKLDAAVASARRMSMEDFQVYQQQTRQRMKTLYKSLCEACRSRIDAA